MNQDSLYPTTLFHFTKKDSFYSILESNFKPSYARETIVGPSSKREFAVPMVSFCDIKLSDLSFFIKGDDDCGYGNFGIGLTKEWANRNGLNPVMYLNRHSDIPDNYNKGLQSIYKTIRNESTSKGYHELLNIYRYMKNYEGDLARCGKKIKDYRFADEREWRFVPPIFTTGVNPFIAISNIRTDAQKKKYNKKIAHIRLRFVPEDIKYLLVETESDIIDLIDHLNRVKSRFNPRIRKKLASRILTVEQLRHDF